MRQFATVLMSNKDQVKKKVTHHWTELKYTNMINPNLTVYYRSFCTKDKETWPKKYKSETIWTLLASRFKIMKNDILIRTQIDNEFSLEEFSIGAQQVRCFYSFITYSQREISIYSNNFVNVFDFN